MYVVVTTILSNGPCPTVEFIYAFSQQIVTGLPLSVGKVMSVGWDTDKNGHIFFLKGGDIMNVIEMQSRMFQMIWGNQNETEYLCPQIASWNLVEEIQLLHQKRR